MTHWQSPAVLRVLRHLELRARHPRRAARRRRSTRTRSSGARRRPRRSSRASCSTGWRSCSGCPRGWHGHIEDTASTSTLVGLAAARELAPGKRVVVASEHCPLVGREGGEDARARAPARRPSTTSSGCGPTLSTSTARARSSRRSGRRRRRRSIRCRRSRTRASARASGSTSTPRTPARRWCARSCAGHSRASSAPTRSSSTRTSGCWCPSTARCCGAAGRRRCARPSASFPSTCARRDDVDSLGDYGPALGRRFRSLKLWAVLRCYGREGLQRLDSRARAAGGAVRGLGARGARVGGLGAAALLARLLPAGRARTRRTRRCSSV